MALPPGMTKHPKTGVYWIRRRVPVDVQPAVGRRIFTETLGTKDKALAEVLYRERMLGIVDRWNRLRAAGPDDPSHRLLSAFAGEFYRSIVAEHQDEPGDPVRWDAERITERRISNQRRVMPSPGYSVAGEMHAFLELRGYDIGGRFRVASPMFYEAKRLAFRTLQRMARGDYSPDPTAVAFPSLPAGLAAPKDTARRPLTVAGDWETFAEVSELSVATRKRWKPLLLRLGEFFGRDDLSAVTDRDAAAWRDHLLDPAKAGKTLSRVTVGDAYLAAARAFFSWARDCKRVPVNPFSGVTVRASKVTHSVPPTPKSFSDEEAKLILSETLRPADPRASARLAAARRWVPWLCAYTGARVNEITQLRSQDVFPVPSAGSEIWVVRITPDAGTVKNRKARDVPLHPHLVEQGFPVFAAGRLGPLFYEAGSGTAANPAYRKVGDKIAAWVRAIGVERDVAPNHGWRHGFNSRARLARMSEETRDHVTGHAPRTVGEGYGEFPLETLAHDIASLPIALTHTEGTRASLSRIDCADAVQTNGFGVLLALAM